MAFECSIVADSVSERGHRLTTMTVTLPRIVLAEFNTHRMFSRNSASSRAIPLGKQLEMITSDGFVPHQFGTAQGGMNAGPPLEGAKLNLAHRLWLSATDAAVRHAIELTLSPRLTDTLFRSSPDLDGFYQDVITKLNDRTSSVYDEPDNLNVSKGLVNRLFEPFMWQTIVVSATELENFFNLRTDSNAQEEIRTAALMMQDAISNSEPSIVREGEWHLPFIAPDERDWALKNPVLAALLSSARCARVSYRNHGYKASDIDKDIEFARRLLSNGHMSPFEHVARPIAESEWTARQMLAESIAQCHLDPATKNYISNQLEFSGNFRGWEQFRRSQPNEAVFMVK